MPMEMIHKLLSDVLDRGFGKWFVAGDSIRPCSGALSPGRPRLMLVLKGSRYIVIDRDGRDSEVVLRRGDILFAGSTCWHKPLGTKQNIVMTYIADPRYLIAQCKENLSGRRHGKMFYNRYCPTTHPVHYLLRALDSARDEGNHFQAISKSVSEAIYRLALDEIGKPEIKSEGKGLRTFREVQDYLRDNFHRTINRDSVARRFRLHSNHLSRLFREYAQEGFTDYLTRIRLEYAQVLLKKNKFTLKQVAGRCGYSDENYFGKVFRRKKGISPGKFKI